MRVPRTVTNLRYPPQKSTAINGKINYRNCQTYQYHSPSSPSEFPQLLRACASLRQISAGNSVHQKIIVLGHAHNPKVSSSLLYMYSVFGDLQTARTLFDEMPVRDVVPWSAIIACYARAGFVDKAFSLFNEMAYDGVRPNKVTLLGMLSDALTFDALGSLHATAIRYGFINDLILTNSFLTAYGKHGRVDSTQRLFDSMVFRDIVSWNSIITGYARNGDFREAMSLFMAMRFCQTFPDHQTYSSLTSAVTNSREVPSKFRKLVHALILTSGYEIDSHINTSLICMYLRYGLQEYAFVLFNRAQNRDAVLWTAMISGLIQNGSPDKALLVFSEMVSSKVIPTTETIASVLAACGNQTLSYVGASVHGYAVRQNLSLDTPAKNSLITMYAKCGKLKQCITVFDEMEKPDIVSWNALISSFSQNGYLYEAFLLFERMKEFHRPDSITVISLLQSCSSVGSLVHGKSVHGFITKHDLKPSISIDTSLVDMYAKCGELESAHRLFSSMPVKDLVTWCTVIEGYGNHGMGKIALQIYADFLDTDMKPNDVMFLSVLSACSHAGLVSEGLQIFKSMKEEFSITPLLSHFACIVDLLCRAGRVEEAYYFAKKMRVNTNADILGIIMDGCSRSKRHDSIAEELAKGIMEIGSDSAGNYVQLLNTYAAMRKWDDVRGTWSKMRALGLKKTAGWSSIESSGSIATFFADHSSHQHNSEIVLLLMVLQNAMTKIDYEEDVSAE